MRNFISRYYYLLIGCSLTLASCEKNNPEVAETQPITGGALVRIIQAVPGSPGIDIFANNTKISGTAVTYPTVFPLNNYSSLPSGNTAVKVVVNTPIPVPATKPVIAYGAELFTTQVAMQEGGMYSIFVTGRPVAGLVSAFVVEDKIPEAIASKAHIRFVNAMPDGGQIDLTGGIVPSNASAPTTINAYFTAQAPNSASQYIAVDAIATGSVYQLRLKNTSSQANVGALLTATLVPGRVYTFWSYGFITSYPVPGTSPAVTVTASQTIGTILNR